MDSLKDPQTLLIFTYAPAGLGHLRVTDSLRDALPPGIPSHLLGAEDQNIVYWHRLTSLSPFFKKIMDWLTAKNNARFFFKIYLLGLRLTASHLYRQLTSLIQAQPQLPKKVVIISTHFGLAHQVSFIKSRLQKKINLRLYLVVQVTDATAIGIWYVPRADFISVPSTRVKQELLAYAHQQNLPDTKILVLPYPLNPTLSQKLSPADFLKRKRQLHPHSKTDINLVIPISGAAVGLNYYSQLIRRLQKINSRFKIFVVCRRNLHTQNFIRRLKRQPAITLITHPQDQQVVDSYQQLYQEKVLSLEIVKPSEQAFKTLFSSRQRGGVILLFNSPVGRQEEDNLTFLLEHQLLPHSDYQQKLYRYALSGLTPDQKDCRSCLQKVAQWKSIRLTDDPKKDAIIINWCLNIGIFSKMAKKDYHPSHPDLSSTGTQQFWQRVDSLLKT